MQNTSFKIKFKKKKLNISLFDFWFLSNVAYRKFLYRSLKRINEKKKKKRNKIIISNILREFLMNKIILFIG